MLHPLHSLGFPCLVRPTDRPTDRPTVTIQNMYLVNPYQGIDLGTSPAGRHLVSGVYGNPLKTGIFVDQCYDVGRIRHVHFWNFWANDPEAPDQVVGPLQNWIAEHGVSLRLARTDWGELVSRL
jgi:hypothetical protein